MAVWLLLSSRILMVKIGFSDLDEYAFQRLCGNALLKNHDFEILTTDKMKGVANSVTKLCGAPPVYWF